MITATTPATLFALRCFPGLLDGLANFELDLYGLLFMAIGGCLLIITSVIFLSALITAIIIKGDRNVPIRQQKVWVIMKGCLIPLVFGLITLPMGMHYIEKDFRKELDEIAFYYAFFALFVFFIFCRTQLKKKFS